MGLFSPKPLPVTSYGYRPTLGATAKGWICTSPDCGRSEHEPVRRWPKPCSACGAPADPIPDAAWSHDAEGAELQWILTHDPDRGGGFHHDQWQIWQFKDAALRGDRQALAAARTDARNYVGQRLGSSPWWSPGSVYFQLVWLALEFGDLDGAADDLRHWLDTTQADDVENDNGRRTNCRQVIDSTVRFFATPGASQHDRAAEIRSGCLRVAEGAYPILSRDLQAAVTAMARG